MPELRHVPLADIDEPQMPVRCAMDEGKLRELAESMADIGLLQPIALKPTEGRFEIEAGHRRYLAAVSLKWNTIPALIFQPDELATGAAMLAENIMREDISAAEEAVLFAQAQDTYKLDEAGLVARFRKSPDYIGDRLRLLRDDPEVFNALLARKVNFSVARELNKCPDEAHRRYLLDAAIRGEVGARVVAQWVQEWRANQRPMNAGEPVTVAATDPHPDTSPELGCAFCGGNRDPWNLVSIFVHKWELDEIRKVLQRAPEGEQCASS